MRQGPQLEAQYQSKDTGSITPLQSRKLKYKSLAENYHFTPIAIETFGSWGPESLTFIKEVGRQIQETRIRKKGVQKLFLKLVLICCQKRVVKTFLHTNTF